MYQNKGVSPINEIGSIELCLVIVDLENNRENEDPANN